MDNRFYLVALGIAGVFVLITVAIWYASGGPASEAAVQNAIDTRTAIAMTGSYLMQPPTRTPPALTETATSFHATSTSLPSVTASISVLPSITNTSLFPQLNTPVPPAGPSLTPYPTLTDVAQVPVFTMTASHGLAVTRAPGLFPQTRTPTVLAAAPTLISGDPTLIQDPAEFARWYFTRVWNERDYQNLWENTLTPTYKANVGSGLFEDYVGWWDSVERVDVHAADVLENNGATALVRVHLTFHMTDGRVVENQLYEYQFVYDPTRRTWMFDYR